MSFDGEQIFLSPPDVGEHEREALLRAFDSGWIAPAGPEIGAFEEELAAYTGVEACAAVSSGTAGLHLGLLAAGVKPGDNVVVQTATFAASAFAVAHIGAKPIFCDVDRRTWNLDPDLLGSWLASLHPLDLPTAVLPVDLYGMFPDYSALAEICARYEIPVVEDAAEALGSISGGSHAGTFGDIGVLSFNGNKIITTSGGGAVLGPADVIDRVRYLSTQARQPVLHYEHDEIGFNYRMSNLLAALGRAQLSRIEDGIARRTEINERYRAELAEFEWLSSASTDRPNNWLSVGLVPEQVDTVAVCRLLADVRIEARPLWKPMHAQPVFANALAIGGDVADEMYRRGICLPSGSSLTEEDQQRVIGAVRWACQQTTRQIA